MPLKIFFCYAHEDEALLNKLKTHLKPLQRQGLVDVWHDRDISAGTEWEQEISKQLNEADIILLLVSPDFMNSDYCYSIEMKRAIERHERGEACVIPVIVRPVYWQGEAFENLQCLPRDAIPVTSWRNRDEAFRDVVKGIRIVIEQLSGFPRRPTHPLFSTSSDHRHRLLKRVRSYWIKGLLEQSLHHEALIALGLQEQPDALANPWELIVQEMNYPSAPLSNGVHITQIYDEADGELLILGEPGAGKTTLLLELTRDLLDRAERNPIHPIPVVFNLSSWGEKRQPLATWLAAELHSKYLVPYKVGETWIDANRILLMLDGLDEVNQVYHSACIDAINSHRKEHGIVSMVICSRQAEYFVQNARLLLNRAIVVQPLTTQQTDKYLASAGSELETLRVALHKDPVLQELATTPLMVSILMLTYHGKTVENLSGDLEHQRKQIFTDYVHRMLERRRINSRYSNRRTLRSLAWLARKLKRNHVTLFRDIELWLPGPAPVGMFNLGILPLTIMLNILIAIRSRKLSRLFNIVPWPYYWLFGRIPLDYRDFLDYATERILLRKVGRDYTFIHYLFLDYFATLKIS